MNSTDSAIPPPARTTTPPAAGTSSKSQASLETESVNFELAVLLFPALEIGPLPKTEPTEPLALSDSESLQPKSGTDAANATATDAADATAAAAAAAGADDSLVTSTETPTDVEALTDEPATSAEPESEPEVELLPLDHPTNARYLSAVRIAIMAADAYSHALFRAINDRAATQAMPPPAQTKTTHTASPAEQAQTPQVPQILPLCPDAPGGSYCLPTMFNGIVWCMRCRGRVRDPEP